MNSNQTPNQPHDGSRSISFFAALFDLVRNPLRIVRLWNWKSALLSIILRGPIFVVATVKLGWQESLAALCVESLYCASTAGFYGALVQSLRNAVPQWLTISFLTLVVPAVFQVLEYSLHWSRGMPHLRLAEIVSVIISALSALFNWYAMRHGTLLVGEEGDRMGTDLRRLPRLLLNFVLAIPRRFNRRSEHRSSGLFHRTLAGDVPQGRSQ